MVPPRVFENVVNQVARDVAGHLQIKEPKSKISQKKCGHSCLWQARKTGAVYRQPADDVNRYFGI
jgi:hypothetical protein